MFSLPFFLFFYFCFGERSFGLGYKHEACDGDDGLEVSVDDE